MRAAKLVDGISLKQDSREYTFAKVLIDLDDFDVSDCSNQRDLPIQLLIKIVAEVIPKVTVCQTRIKDFDNLCKLCTPCVESKSTRV